MSLKSHDKSLKYLLAQDPAGFIQFGLRPHVLSVLRPVETDLPARDRLTDGGYLVDRDGDRQVVHVEFYRMHQGVTGLALDIGEAQVRLRRKEGVPVYSLLYDLYGSRRAPVRKRRALWLGEKGDRDGTRISYVRVNLRGMTAAELIQGGPKNLYPLVPLTADGAEVRQVLRAAEAIEGRRELSATVRADHLTVLNFLAEAEKVPMMMLESYLTKEKLMESNLYKSIYSDGRAEGEAKALIRLLMARMGAVPADAKQTILSRAKDDPEAVSLWFAEATLALDKEAALALVRKITAV